MLTGTISSDRLYPLIGGGALEDIVSLTPIGEPRQKVTLTSLREKKAHHEPITCLTAYDYATAKLVDEAAIDVILVSDTLKLRLEGRFTGEYAEQTRMLTTRCRNGTRFVVDLTDVEFIDAVGEDVLSFFGRFGAELIAPTSYTLDVCERLNLPVVPARNSRENTSSLSPMNDGQCRPDAPEPEKNKL
jgi:hypothetical protein